MRKDRVFSACFTLWCGRTQDKKSISETFPCTGVRQGRLGPPAPSSFRRDHSRAPGARPARRPAVSFKPRDPSLAPHCKPEGRRAFPLLGWKGREPRLHVLRQLKSSRRVPPEKGRQGIPRRGRRAWRGRRLAVQSAVTGRATRVRRAGPRGSGARGRQGPRAGARRRGRGGRGAVGLGAWASQGREGRGAGVIMWGVGTRGSGRGHRACGVWSRQPQVHRGPGGRAPRVRGVRGASRFTPRPAAGRAAMVPRFLYCFTRRET